MFSISAIASAALIGDFPHQHRDFGKPGHLRRAPASLAGDQFVAIAPYRAHQHRLHQALRLDRGGELGERLLVHAGARLVLARPDRADRQASPCESLRCAFVAAEQRIQAAA